MRKILALMIGTLALAGAPAHAERLRGEAKLAQMLEGRVAGEPVRCVNLRNVRASRVVDRTAIVYEAGSTIYVNRPQVGAESLNQWDALVTRLHSTQLCDIDVVTLVDTATGMYSGSVFLGEFVPYRRVRAD